MKIELVRKIRTDEYTIGSLYINGKEFSDTLEDTDRGLTSTMPEEFIKKIKVAGATAIPVGTYELIIDMSTRFGKLMPHILNVKGFNGIRIHARNKLVICNSMYSVNNEIEVAIKEEVESNFPLRDFLSLNEAELEFLKKEVMKNLIRKNKVCK